MPHNAVYVYIGWDDVFSLPPHSDGLEYYLRRLPRHWLIPTIGKIATTLFNSGSYFLNPNQQIQFMLSLKKEISYYERIVRLISTKQNRVLVYPELVSTLTKYALLYGCNDNEVPGYAYDYLVRAILLLNTEYGKTNGTKGSSEDRRSFLPYELELMLGSRENFSFVIARYYQFFQWARAQASNVNDFLPIADDFSVFFGMTYEEYAAAAFAILTSFMRQLSLGDWRQQLGELNVDEWVATLEEKQHIKNILDMIAINSKSAIDDLSQMCNRFGLTDLRVFMDFPLLRLENSFFACPYQGFLRNRLGLGLYFALFNKYKERGACEHLKLSRFFGKFLEDYLYGLVYHGSMSNKSVQVFSEQIYKCRKGQSKSSDIVMIAGNIAIFMDVTRKRFKLEETLCERISTALAEDVDQTFVQKAEQIHNSIADFKEGLFFLGEINPSRIKHFIPVIVTEQDFPQLIALPEIIHSAIRSAGWLADYKPCQILAAEDIEAVYISEQQSDLAGILMRKASSEKYRYRDLPSYLKDCEPHIIQWNAGDLSLPGYREFFDAIVTPKLREWGLPT